MMECKRNLNVVQCLFLSFQSGALKLYESLLFDEGAGEEKGEETVIRERER